MDIGQISFHFPGWTLAGTAGQTAFGPLYSMEKSKNNSTTYASALVIPVPNDPAQLQALRASGMDDLDITRKLQTEVDRIVSKCTRPGVKGLLQCRDYDLKHHEDTQGWDVAVLTEPVIPLSARMELVGTEAQIQRFAKAAAETLDACEKKGIRVGELTPDRIFVTPADEFRLSDLCSDGSGAAGTVSLGLLLYWLLSGRQGPIPTPGAALNDLPNVSPEFSALVLGAARGATAAELLQGLSKLPAIPAGPTSSPKPDKSGKRKPILPLILALAAAAVVLFLLLRSCGSAEPGPSVPETTVPATTEPTVPLGWSDWMESIPNEVTTDLYMIQEQPLYQVQVLENTSSVTDTVLEGWTFVETVDERGEFLEWSEWQDAAPEEDPDREIESAMRYRTKTKETTTDSAESKDGWTRYDSTSKRVNFGEWGSWSTDKLSNTETRDVESKQQYQYREKAYTTSEKSSLDGWTQYDSKTSYGSWGDWSDWSDKKVSSSDTVQIETREVEVPGKTEYVYSAYYSSNSPRVNSNFPHPCGTCAAERYGGTWSLRSHVETSRRQGASFNWKCDHVGKVSTRYQGSNGLFYYYEKESVTAPTYKTQYRYQTRSKTVTYSYYKWGEWSNWSDSKPSSSDERQVQDRTVYRSRSCETVYTYAFYRWTDWSGWTETPASANSTTEVETKTVYRYHDREIIPTHYFTRWSDWSDFTTAYAAPSETQHVQSKLHLRYIRRDQLESSDSQWLFTDVAESDANREAIQWVVDRGITKGTSETTFSPGDAFTRRQMAIMFWRALGYPEPMNHNMVLSDVTTADPYRNAIYWAVESGIMDVVAPGTFGVNETATRSDFILSLYRTVGSPDVILTQEPFSDVEPDMREYKAVLWAYERSISHGLSENVFGAEQPCTRLQASVMFYKALYHPIEESPTETSPAE